MDSQALWLTLRLALTTTALLLALALPLAWWIASGTDAVRALVQAVVALPLVLPPTVLGFYLLVALGPLTAPGRVIIRLLGHPLAFSFSGLVLGSVLYSLPFAVQPLVAGFRAIDPALGEVASTLGASPMRIFRTITLPLAKSSLITAAVLTFTHTVGEFGVVLMIGGNVFGRTRVLSMRIYDHVEAGEYLQAHALSLCLLAFSFVALLVMQLLRPHRMTAHD